MLSLLPRIIILIISLVASIVSINRSKYAGYPDLFSSIGTSSLWIGAFIGAFLQVPEFMWGIIGFGIAFKFMYACEIRHKIKLNVLLTIMSLEFIDKIALTIAISHRSYIIALIIIAVYNEVFAEAILNKIIKNR